MSHCNSKLTLNVFCEHHFLNLGLKHLDIKALLAQIGVFRVTFVFQKVKFNFNNCIINFELNEKINMF